MTHESDAQRTAIEAFKQAVAAGAPREAARDAALARYRGLCPGASEYEARTALAKALAEERLAAHAQPRQGAFSAD